MDIKVSVICNTFNHEKFIRKTLDSFVNQITNFPFEVLIHDDASTDNTAKIIKEYELKYPCIIKPIYQTVNQYSQGISITRTIQMPRAKGKYIAFCEGDDYWIDPLKLQKQFNVLEKYPNLDMCAHGAKVLNCQTGKMDTPIAPKNKSCIISLKEVISGGGAYLPTASLFFRKSIDINPPRFRRVYNIDYSLQVLGAIKGGIYYIAEEMAVYRLFTPSSFTVRLRNDYSKKIKHKKKMRSLFRLLDRYTHKEYHRILTKFLIKNYFSTTVFYIALFSTKLLKRLGIARSN